MAYRSEERERIIRVSYEFYNITDETMQERVTLFLEENPWAKPHANIVFVYIRTLTDYKVLSELGDNNDIRLRNSLVNSIDKLHKQLFSYREVRENPVEADEEDELFNVV